MYVCIYIYVYVSARSTCGADFSSGAECNRQGQHENTTIWGKRSHERKRKVEESFILLPTRCPSHQQTVPRKNGQRPVKTTILPCLPSCVLNVPSYTFVCRILAVYAYSMPAREGRDRWNAVIHEGILLFPGDSEWGTRSGETLVSIPAFTEPQKPGRKRGGRRRRKSSGSGAGYSRKLLWFFSRLEGSLPPCF